MACNGNNNKFFEDFRFSKVLPNDQLYTSKAKLLLNDLSSEDSTARTAAKDRLSNAPFSKAELPLLHDALLKQYADEGYDNTKETLQKVIADIKDSSSYSFAKDHYLSATDKDKNLLLSIMLAFPTTAHFSDVKTLLLQQPPRQQPGYSFASDLTDSLQLAASIFTDLLPLLKDTVMAPSIIRVAKPLLDSGLINVAVMQPYQQNIIQLAQKNYKNIRSNPDSYDYDYSTYALLDVLGYMNNATTNAVLQNWTSLKKSPYLQMSAACKLLRNKQALNPIVLQNLAAEKATRTELYDSLRAYKKEALFPKAYLTQKDFAESYVYNAASDDDNEPSNLTYLTQKVINFKGRQARFYFYKVTSDERDDASYRLACAGPFNVNADNISASDATGEIYYEEEFDPEHLPAQMDALIKQLEGEYEWGSKNRE